VSEPEVALAFTPDPWVEQVHRHLTDHGGARVRSVVVEPAVALEETYDVLVAGHRWPALTRALVADVHARGRAVVGIYDREEPASRRHLLALGVDTIIESDASLDSIVRAIGASTGAREDVPGAAPSAEPRAGRLVAIGGPPGTGRTEVAVHCAMVLARTSTVALVDADDVAPAVAQRLHIPIEPNLRTAIDAVEHGQGSLDACVRQDRRFDMAVLNGVSHPAAWSQTRPGEVLRVVDALAQADDALVVADGAGMLDDVGTATGRGRYATARALVTDADALVAVCDASPHGVTRLLAWAAQARALAADTPLVVCVNRVPGGAFRRGELFEEIAAHLDPVDMVFAPYDARVADASWRGVTVGRGPFLRAVERLELLVAAVPRRREEYGDACEVAS
jgi:MinD-like ATPase involved in chromosome partitioning or flagellar assembly